MNALDLRRDRIYYLALLLAALGFAAYYTRPAAIVLINWDNAAYIAGIASGRYSWSSLPWSSHLGVGQEYLLGVWLARALGGSVIDGFRLVNAVAFAAIVLFLADLIKSLTGSRALSLAGVLLWATAWVNLHYHLILEDNFLFLAPGTALLHIAVRHVDRFTPRHALLTGSLALLGWLASYQAIPYLGCAIWAALIGPGRSPWQRLRDTGLVLVGFAASLGLWVLVTRFSSGLSLRQILTQVLMGPVPNFAPHSLSEVIKYLGAGRPFFETLGNGVLWNLSFDAYWLSQPPPISRLLLGIAASALILVALLATTLWSWRRQKWAAHLLAATLAFASFTTSLHRDLVDYTGLKRYDFVPLLGVMLLAVLWAPAVQRLARRRQAFIALLTLGLAVFVSLFQLRQGLDWGKRQREKFITLPDWNHLPHPEMSWYGRHGQSYYEHFHSLRRSHPAACLFVFSLGEIAPGGWNFDVTGSLWSELPNHLVVANDELVAQLKPQHWRIPPGWRLAKGATIPACAWISPAAAALLRR
jgi:hypothetical protein